MSYEIAKSITSKGDKFKIVARSNNVFPSHYWSVEIPRVHEALFSCIESGSIQPTESANGYKWSYIEIMLKGVEGDERLKRFKELVDEPQHKGKYIISTASGLVHKMTKKRVWFTDKRELAKEFGYYEAVVKSKWMSYTYSPQVVEKKQLT